MPKTQSLTFSEAIERVLRDHQGYASLLTIYRDIEKYRPLTGKTPHKTIQERVQRDPRFARIGLGVYALRSEIGKLPKPAEPRTAEDRAHSKHTRMQGMLIEIGNLEGFDTYTADPKKVFENKRLGAIATLAIVPAFTFPKVVSTTRYIDVLWLNSRHFPARAFEVEYSTNIRNSLVKFTELQDFNTQFFIVAPEGSRPRFAREIDRSSFVPIAGRCKFWSFEKLERLYKSRLDLANAVQSMDLEAVQ
jgi:hypothetical protein